MANRTCGPEGLWQTKDPGVYSDSTGFTEYKSCYNPWAKQFYDTYFAGKSENERVVIDLTISDKLIEMIYTLF